MNNSVYWMVQGCVHHFILQSIIGAYYTQYSVVRVRGQKTAAPTPSFEGPGGVALACVEGTRCVLAASAAST
jgi:hypothetical protein